MCKHTSMNIYMCAHTPVYGYGCLHVTGLELFEGGQASLAEAGVLRECISANRSWAKEIPVDPFICIAFPVLPGKPLYLSALSGECGNAPTTLQAIAYGVL